MTQRPGPSAWIWEQDLAPKERRPFVSLIEPTIQTKAQDCLSKRET